MPEENKQQPSSAPEREPQGDNNRLQPWRTEGLPKKDGHKPRSRWIPLALMVLSYLVFFGVLTLQDRMSGPESISYTEFKAQVANKNVAEVFARGDTIQGSLRKEAALPGQANRTYKQFTTERPTFAADDLLSELSADQATVRATPLIQQRGVIANMLISIAPFLLLIAFYIWIFSADDAADVGVDEGTDVSSAYKQRENRFTGKIEKVLVEVR